MTGRKKFALKPRPSLRDLAEQLGVSHTTVNLALQNNPKISESLRLKIRDLAARQGYFPNDLAWGLRSGQTGLIGIVVPNITAFAPLADAASRFFWAAGYYPIILCSDENPSVETEMLHGLARRRAEGILLCPTPEEREKGTASGVLCHHMPLVTVGYPIKPIGVPVVANDEAQSARVAVQQLTAAGHRQIVRVGAAKGSAATAFAQAVKAAKAKGKTVASEPGTPAKELHAQLEKEFKKGSRTAASAIVCDGDAAAWAVNEWCQASGRRIPGDLSVVAISPSGAALPFTAVEAQADKIAQSAAEVLVRQLGNKAIPELTVVKPRIVKRDTVQKAQGSK